MSTKQTGLDNDMTIVSVTCKAPSLFLYSSDKQTVRPRLDQTDINVNIDNCFEENTFKPRCKSCKQQFVPVNSRRGLQRFCRNAGCLNKRPTNIPQIVLAEQPFLIFYFSMIIHIRLDFWGVFFVLE